MATGDSSKDEPASGRSIGSLPVLPVVLAALALLVGTVFVGSRLLGTDGDGSETSTDAASATTSTPATTTADNTDDALATDDGGSGDDQDAVDELANDDAGGEDGNAEPNTDAGAAPAAADEDGQDDDQDNGAGDSPSVPTTAGNNSPDQTVEEDRGATPDSDGPADDPTELETTTTTALSADGSRCRITPADVNGQSGVTKPSEDGICAGIEVTLRSVVDTTNVGSIDWANDLKLCEKHPSATQIGFAVSSASGSTEVTDTFFRGDVAEGQDLVDALNISFSGGYTPTGGVQPIAVCRSSDAEMVIVHRGNG